VNLHGFSLHQNTDLHNIDFEYTDLPDGGVDILPDSIYNVVASHFLPRPEFLNTNFRLDPLKEMAVRYVEG
jgi:hypothetical protein